MKLARAVIVLWSAHSVVADRVLDEAEKAKTSRKLCDYCRRAQPLIHEAFAGHDGVRHVKVADASLRRLGRSFAVKVWPTLVFLKDGREAWNHLSISARAAHPSDHAKAA